MDTNSGINGWNERLRRYPVQMTDIEYVHVGMTHPIIENVSHQRVENVCVIGGEKNDMTAKHNAINIIRNHSICKRDASASCCTIQTKILSQHACAMAETTKARGCFMVKQTTKFK